jgi:Flp pilus assembly protein TadG
MHPSISHPAFPSHQPSQIGFIDLFRILLFVKSYSQTAQLVLNCCAVKDRILHTINLRSTWRRRSPHPRMSLRRSQKGQVLVLFALSMVALLAVSGVALNAGLDYFSQTGMQSAADNASLAAARMLAADYRQQATNPGSLLPYSYSNIVQEVQTVMGANSAGADSVSSYAGYFTTLQGGILCQFWPDTGSITLQSDYCPNTYDLTSGIPYDSSGNILFSGARVVSTNTHPVVFPSILGGGPSTVTTGATTVYGVISSVSIADLGYAVYDVNCQTNGPLELGQQITYYSPQWKKIWGCSNIGDSNFKGDMKMYQPSPVQVPGWAAGSSGSGTVMPVSAGSTILLAMVDCIAHDSPCSEPSGSSFCSSVYPPNLPTSGYDTMCVVGLVALKALDNCNTGSTCTGIVVPYYSNQTGVTLCPTATQPTCPTLSSNPTRGGTALAVELYK